MTDLERVREEHGTVMWTVREDALGRGSVGAVDFAEAIFQEACAAHLKEDAEREAKRIAYRNQAVDGYAALQAELTELREAVRDAIETASRYPDEAYAQLRRGSRLRQLIEEKE